MHPVISLLSLTLFFPCALKAVEPSLPPCPGSRFEATVEPATVDEGGYKLIFRKSDSGKVLGDLSLSFPTLKLIWSPDGHYAAVEYLYVRHFVRVDVFEILDSGVRKAAIEDYTENVYGRLGALHGGRGQVDSLIKWLSKDQLLIQTMGSTSDSESDLGYCYQVQIRLQDSGDLVGSLEKIEKTDPARGAR